MLLMTLKKLWARVKGAAALTSALVIGIFVAHRSGKRAGRKEEANRRLEKRLKDEGKIHEADSKVAQMDDDDVRIELRSWVRNDDD